MTALPIFVINLKRRPDRLAAVSARLQALGLGFTRIEAIDGASALPRSVGDATADARIWRPLTSGEKACGLSHVAAWDRFLEGGASAGLVLEDDAVLSSKLTRLVLDDTWIPPDASLVKADMLEGFSNKVVLCPACLAVPGGIHLRRLRSNHVGSAGYFVTRRGVRVLRDASASMNVPLDHFLFDPERSRVAASLRVYQLTPALVTQEGEGNRSDLVSGRLQRDISRSQATRGKWRKRWLRFMLLPRKMLSLVLGARKTKVSMDEEGVA